jgi:hypothetical protein
LVFVRQYLCEVPVYHIPANITVKHQSLVYEGGRTNEHLPTFEQDSVMFPVVHTELDTAITGICQQAAQYTVTCMAVLLDEELNTVFHPPIFRNVMDHSIPLKEDRVLPAHRLSASGQLSSEDTLPE